MILSIMALFVAGGAAIGPDTAIGRWRTETRNGVVEIAHCGTSVCGTLLTSDGIRADPDLRDSKNSDARLRGRRLAGLQILGGFVRDTQTPAGIWSGGTIYNADDGGNYKATLTPADADHLKVKGCIVWPLCKTQSWARVR